MMLREYADVTVSEKECSLSVPLQPFHSDPGVCIRTQSSWCCRQPEPWRCEDPKAIRRSFGERGWNHGFSSGRMDGCRQADCPYFIRCNRQGRRSQCMCIMTQRDISFPHIYVQLAVHRADLHSALLRSATSLEGPGTPCKVLLNHKVVRVVGDCIVPERSR
jgi:hypothetical protein